MPFANLSVFLQPALGMSVAKSSHQKLGNGNSLRSWAGVRCGGLTSPEDILHAGAVESQDPRRCWAGAETSSARRRGCEAGARAAVRWPSLPPGTAALTSWSGSLTRGLPLSCSTRTKRAFSDELVPTTTAEGTGSPPRQTARILAQQRPERSSPRARSSPAQLGSGFQESCPTPRTKLSFRQDYKLSTGRAKPSTKGHRPKGLSLQVPALHMGILRDGRGCR